MRFQLDKSQKQIRDAVREFARGEFDKEQLLSFEKEGRFPTEIWQKAAELGFIGLHFDEEAGGGGLGLFENTLVAETLCQKDSTCGMALMLSGFASELILRFGTAEQKKRWLPPIAEGKSLCGGAFMEPGRGYLLTDIASVAIKEEKNWILTGEKTHVVNAGVADFFVVLAKTAPELPPEKALSLFVVDQKEALKIAPAQRGLGGTMTPMGRIQFDHIHTPDTQRIGKEGAGLAMVQAFLGEARLLQAAMALGIAQGALDRTVSYAAKREQFSRKIASFETIQHKMAEMATKLEAARQLTYQTAQSFGSKTWKKEGPLLSCMATQTACQVAEEVADEAIQIHGGYGYMQEGEVEHFYRDAKYLKLFYSNPNQRNRQIAASLIKGAKP